MNASSSRWPSPRPRPQSSPLSIIVVFASLVVGCTGSASSGAPPVGSAPAGGSPSAAASAIPGSPASASATPSEADPSASQSPPEAPSPDRTPITIAGCPTTSREGRVPSDTLTKVAVDQDFGVDRITFTFGPAGPQPGSAPTGEVKPARQPFYAGASGETVTIAGDRFIQVTFRQMTTSDEAGNAVFTGNDDLHPKGLAVREVRELEEFEGVVTWVAGVRGPGCVRVSRLTSPDRIVVEVQQP